MTCYITRVVAGEETQIELTEKEILEAKVFCGEMLAHEEIEKPFNKAFLLRKEVKKGNGTHEVYIILSRAELEKCLYAI